MKTLKFMLAAATAIGLASATQADQYNTTGFEKLTVGDSVTTGVQDNYDGYSYFYYAGSVAEDNESVIAEADAELANVARPRGAAAVDAGRDKVLQVSTGTDPLMRTYAPIAGGQPQAATTLTADTYVDTLVQFTVTPYTDTVTPSNGVDKLMIYLKESVTTNELGEITEVNTNLVVVGGFFNGDTTVAKEYGLNTGSVTVNPNEWHRLTVKAIVDISGDYGAKLPGFQIWVDGTLCALANGAVTYDALNSDALDLFGGFSTAETIDEGKIVLSLLAAGGEQTAKLQGVGFAGEGKVDDIVFSELDPFATVFDFTFSFDTAAGVSAVTYTVGGTQYTQAQTFPEVTAGTEVTIDSITYADDAMPDSITAVNLSDPVEGVYTVTNAGASLTITAKDAYAKIGDTKYETFVEALSTATAGQTVTLLRDAVGPISTAAGTLDLNDKKLAATKIEFTGTGAKTLTGGDVTNLAAITVVSPAGQNLTIDDMTFHFDITPVGTGSVLTVSNCTFENDLDNKGKTGEAADGDDRAYHSFGLKLLSNTAFDQADVVGNTFKQARRCGIAINKFVGDVYVYDNTFDGTKNCLNWSETSGGSRFSAMQIYAQGRVFIENNSFSGEYIAEPFALYNEGATNKQGVAVDNVSSSAALVFNGNTVASSVPYLWAFYESTQLPLPVVTNAPNLFFGSNTIAAEVDKTQGKYKTVVQPVPVEYAENLALPTGYTTVYDWTHADGTTDYFVNDAFAADLGSVASGDTIVAVPGADVTLSVVGLKLDADATYKNKWAVSQLTSPTTELEPGEKKEFSAEPTPAELAAITIVASDAVSNALTTAGVSLSDYEGMFETVAVQEGGVWYAEVIPTAATTNSLQIQVNADVAAVVPALGESTVTVNATPGFYYSVSRVGSLPGDFAAGEGDRVLATGSTVELPMPVEPLGASAGFYKVMVNIAPKATQQSGGQD